MIGPLPQPAPHAGAAVTAPQARGAEVDPKLREATLGFEKLLLAELLEPVTESAGEDAPPLYRELLGDAVAQAIADAGGIGLAAELQRALLEGGR